ncbi:hypothetical protein DFJ73DRAFT_929595 [Zopfochytrium polystomum]|nr:hypothetical protein DFJ73DRAFT_929595 [Zopfochytrium polystomum]
MQTSSSTIIVVGKSGLGKSTFCNIYSRSNNPTGAGAAGVSTEPIEVWLEKDGTRVSIIDMPGYGDVGGPNREPINDNVIHRWLLNYVMNRKVIGIVVFVSQDDVCQARLAPEVKSLLEVLGTRFAGFEALCFFAVSGRSMPGSMNEFLQDAASSVLTGKLRIMGLGARNWARCKKKDFSAVARWTPVGGAARLAILFSSSSHAAFTETSAQRCIAKALPVFTQAKQVTRTWVVGKVGCAIASGRAAEAQFERASVPTFIIHAAPAATVKSALKSATTAERVCSRLGARGRVATAIGSCPRLDARGSKATTGKGEMTKHVIQFESLDHAHAIDESKVEVYFENVDDDLSPVEAYRVMERLVASSR